MFRQEFSALTEASNDVPKEYQNLTRYIPSGAQVITKLGEKSLKITIITAISAPPLNTKDVPSIDRRLKSDTNNFIGDVENTIFLKGAKIHPYIFMEGKPKSVWFTQEVTLTVNNKVEGAKLAILDEALSFYKNRKEPMS